jgi:hypothetical protein
MEKELIICSAIRTKDGYIYRGQRHSDCFKGLAGMPEYANKGHIDSEQGFITSQNRFVGRKEAWSIFRDDDESGWELFSEDLY